jgi:sugar/nucleoside kinase (ribokinase family)
LAAGTIFGLAQGEILLSAIQFGLAAAALSLESEETVRKDLTPTLLFGRIDAGVTQ